MPANVRTPLLQSAGPLEPFITTAKHIFGWLAYGSGSGPQGVFSVGFLNPLLLMQNAHKHGVLESDLVTQCSVSPTEPCVVQLFGLSWVNTNSLVFVAGAISTFIQVLAMFTVGAISDYRDNRKKIVVLFTITGVISSLAIAMLPSHLYELHILLFIFADVSNVLCGSIYDSFLPILVRHSHNPDLHYLRRNDAGSILEEASSSSSEGDEECATDEEGPVLLENSVVLDAKHPEEHFHTALSTKLSSWAFCVYFSSTLIFQIVYVFLSYFNYFEKTLLRNGVLITAVWLLLSSIPLALFLKTPVEQTASRSFFSLLFGSWSESFQSLKHAMEIPAVRIFLFSRMFLVCALQTSLSAIVIYSRAYLGMSNFQLLITISSFTLLAIFGTLGFPTLTKSLNLSSLQTVILAAFVLPLAPLYGLIGDLPFTGPQIGFTSIADAYAVTIFLGFMVGGLHTYCRSIFSQLLPKGREARFFSLYAIVSQTGVCIGQVALAILSNVFEQLGPVYIFLTIILLSTLIGLLLLYRHNHFL
ncbi:vacuolar amino acid efflux transporter Atg22 [Schizosaccharomyces japonicus yFS275]|uniref:Autophagy-related protein n=1 Tax=Schizosaccharomyces japonicus (strain yFS275 / FY16936) TaxID=402676 RepID=B6K5C9_SCHJY|nr:vacuolar amino acid efflux transporter Atg22 [Schizosaccharomyces japonicus yFS275]EEB08733.1 vacuolar amino acid efflux transporter Atg22 [Schizosaccharomyces japonicus yFS275]